jgi:SET domain
MFCSEECKAAAMKSFFEIELATKYRDINQRRLYEALQICDGNFDKLKQLNDDPELKAKTIFDFDFSDPNDPLFKYNQLLAYNGLKLGPKIPELKMMQNHPILQLMRNDRERNIAMKYLERTLLIMSVNSDGLDWKTADYDDNGQLVASMESVKVGSGIRLFGSLLNHSCSPNVARTVVDDKFVFFVKRPIQKGQQLFVSYG